MKVDVKKLTGKCKRCGKCCSGVIHTNVWQHSQISPGTERVRTRSQMLRILRELGFKVLKVNEYRNSTVLQDKGGIYAVWDLRLRCSNFVDGGCRIDAKKPRFCAVYPLYTVQPRRSCGFKWKTVARRVKG